MALISDNEGFLVGTPIAMDTTRFNRVASLWRDIKRDTAAIRKSLREGAQAGSSQNPNSTSQPASNSQSSSSSQPASNSQPSSSSVALPLRDANGRFISMSSIFGPQNQNSNANTNNATPQNTPPVINSPATNGQPQNNPNTPEENENPNNPPGDGRSGFFKRIFGEVASAVRSGFSGASANTENIDPAIAAAREAGGLVAPVLKPIGALISGAFGRRAERKKQREAARLNAIENHNLALPWYKRMLGIGGASTASGGGEQSSGGILGMLSGGVLGILASVMVPLLGGLLTAAVPLILTGIGALAAGALGGWIGTKIGNWVNEQYGDKISMALGDTIDFVKDSWGAVTAKWDEAGAKASEWIDKASAVWADFRKIPGKAKGAIGNGIDSVKGVFGYGSAGRKKSFEDSLTAAGITNPTERAMMMAQAHHETGGFRNMEESFKYTPEQLRATNKRASGLSSDAMSSLMKSGSSGIAEFMYGGRLGNDKTGDGYKYRGRGFSQLTGKANYAEAGKALGLDLVNNPDLAADPAIAGKISAWFHKTRNLSGAAKAGDVSAVTRGINGGSNGLSSREDLFKQYRAEAGILGSGTIDRSGSRMAVGSGSLVGPSMARAGSSGMAAPNIDRYAIAKAPDLAIPIGIRDKKSEPSQVTVSMPVTQNIGDRQIAQLATGGMGGTGQ